MPLSRRALLRLTAVAAGSSVLAACGSSTPRGSSEPVEGAGTGTPRRGGTVRLAFTGGGATESLDPLTANSPADLVRNSVVFDRLFTLDEGAPSPVLAVSAEPDADARSFVLTLREGVTWHDGSPLSADDVAYTFTRLASPDNTYATELPVYLDIDRVSVTGALTLTVPTLQPVGDPAMLLAGAQIPVMKNGATSFEPGEVVGTGAYRVEAFAPGRETRLVPYGQHWNGEPYADELVILSVDDPQARMNAVRGGQADYASDIPYALAAAGAGADGLELRSAGERHRTGYGYILNAARPLPADPRVRMALRLAVDRQALVDAVYLGHGVVGNDLFGNGALYHASDIAPLERDVNRARQLLTEAGADGATIVVRSSDYEAGLNAATELYVEQFREVGLDAQAQLVSPVEHFAEGLGTADAIAFPLGPSPLSVIFARTAAWPELAFADPELEAAIATAQSTTDEQEREQAWLTAQQVMADRGNWVVWGFGDVLSLTRKDVTGIQVHDSAKYPYLGKVGFLA